MWFLYALDTTKDNTVFFVFKFLMDFIEELTYFEGIVKSFEKWLITSQFTWSILRVQLFKCLSKETGKEKSNLQGAPSKHRAQQNSFYKSQ